MDRVSVPLSDGGFLELRLSSQPEFRLALKVARDSLKGKGLSPDLVEAIARRDAAADAIAKALAAGENVSGATLAWALCSPSHAEHLWR